MIASVSYNGVKLATTGDAGSRWKYTTDNDEMALWHHDDYTAQDSLWNFVNTSAVCEAQTVPSMNRYGLSYSEFISANGVTPARNSPQFGGEIARWIGVNENNGDCSVEKSTLYRITLDLTALVNEPFCFDEDDGRALLSSSPIIHVPEIGLKSQTSQLLTFVGGVEGFFKVWVDGIGAEGHHGKMASNILVARLSIANNV